MYSLLDAPRKFLLSVSQQSRTPPFSVAAVLGTGVSVARRVWPAPQWSQPPWSPRLWLTGVTANVISSLFAFFRVFLTRPSMGSLHHQETPHGLFFALFFYTWFSPSVFPFWEQFLSSPDTDGKGLRNALPTCLLAGVKKPLQSTR